ncbi:MAG: hypothetical protein ACOYM2_14600 [Rectinemataceae bacterium]
MSKLMLAIPLLVLSLGLASAQTVELQLRCSGAFVPASAPREIQTGVLDRLFAEGLIVTTSTPATGDSPEELQATMDASGEGRVDLLLVVSATWSQAVTARNLPDSFTWTVYRISDRKLLASGMITTQAAGITRQADSIKSLRLVGESMAKAALPSMRKAFAALFIEDVHTARRLGATEGVIT